MESVPVANGFNSSTPVHSRNRNCRSQLEGIENICSVSPISKVNFPDSIERVTDSGYSNLNLKFIKPVNRKLAFCELPSYIDFDREDFNSYDSGIDLYDNVSSNDNQYFRDENCNIIENFSSNSCLQLSQYKYVESHIKTSNNNELWYDTRQTQDNKLCQTNHLLKIGSFDMLNALDQRNCSCILSKILSYLCPKDLQKASHVSKGWQNIVASDRKACARKQKYIDEQKELATGPSKENRYSIHDVKSRDHKSVFINLINSSAKNFKQPLNVFPEGGFQSFIQETEKLQPEEMLGKCSKCNYPAKYESRTSYRCTRQLCQYLFCIKCLGPYLEMHSCSLPKLNVSLPTVIIGSRKSKKNLRRL